MSNQSPASTNNVIKTIDEIITAKNYYFIPLYQRGYRWTTEQSRTLINDIYANFKRNFDNFVHNQEDINVHRNTGYCIQPLVVKDTQEQVILNGTVYTKYNVIDGQQRLTTLAIFFYALNALSQGTTNYEINIGYERGDLNIGNFCQEISDVIKISKDSEKEKIASKFSEKKLSIDQQFILNVYLDCYFFFQEKAAESSDYFRFFSDYFRFLDVFSTLKLSLFGTMFTKATTVIWYEPDQNDEQKIFENLNARNIRLTKSELVKALFMNPEKYISENGNDLSKETIKVRQVNIGSHWDDIERQLHDVNFWHFFPHLEKIHQSTHFDAVIDLFVYKKEKEIMGTKFNQSQFSDQFINKDRFIYNKLEKWITDDLEKHPDNKSDIMKKWWDEICDVYEWFYMIYSLQHLSGGKPFEIYHRIALLQLMTAYHYKYVSKKGSEEAKSYFEQVDLCIDLIDLLEHTPKTEIRKELNKKIQEMVSNVFENSTHITVFSAKFANQQAVKEKCDSLEKKIRALVYSSDNYLITSFLLMDSLYSLEQSGSSLSRFDFYEFTKKNEKKSDCWVKEHIFARGTNFSEDLKDNMQAKTDFLKNLNGCGWKEYLEYKYKDILTPEQIEQLKTVKEQYLRKIRDVLDLESQKPADWDKTIDALLAPSKAFYESADTDTVLEHEESPEYASASEFLKDNSMGNMSILSMPDNTGVGNGTYPEKKKTIREYIEKGKFIPMNAVNVFTGWYCTNEFSADYWYPCHRLNYLKQLICHIEQYLEVNKNGN